MPVSPHVTCASGNVFARYFPVPYAYCRPEGPAAKCMQNGPSTEARVKESSWVKMKVIHFDFLLTSRLTHTLHVHQEMCLQNISPPRTLRISWNTARYNLFFFFFFFFFFYIHKSATLHMHQEMCEPTRDMCIRKCVCKIFPRTLRIFRPEPRRKMHAEWTQHGSEGQRKLVSKNESHPFWLSFDKSIDPHVTCASKNVFARYFPVPYA